MNIDEMITLENDESYGLLLEGSINGVKYFLSVRLNSNEEPTNDFKVFKEEINGADTFVTEEENPSVLEVLLKDYNNQMEQMED